ncbi:MAG TPA: hypothetical protein VD927_08250 [Chryseosolibacter sp.]|nr:hypothetical protein [Chryseosolibacter sp.]
MRSRYYVVFVMVCAMGCASDASSDMASQSGQGGSMSIFAISGERLYAVDDLSIHVYNIADGKFTRENTTEVGFGIETIFARDPYLYLGARDAMYIYSIADPAAPAFIFRYQHIVSCDPVVVQGNRAYVTLREGNACNVGANALEIIDISDPYNPSLIANYPMQSPHGLSITGKYLFVCEGQFGFKLFDVSNELEISLIKHVDNHFAYDVIARPGHAIVTGDDGVFQYGFSVETEELTLLSTIDIEREGVQ